jgi:hypothetical protein
MPSKLANGLRVTPHTKKPFKMQQIYACLPSVALGLGNGLMLGSQPPYDFVEKPTCIEAAFALEHCRLQLFGRTLPHSLPVGAPQTYQGV